MTSRKTQHECAGSYWLTKYNKAKGRLILLIIIKQYSFSFTLHVRAYFVKENKSFSLIKEIKLCKEATVELSIYVKDFPKNLSEEMVKMSEQRA